MGKDNSITMQVTTPCSIGCRVKFMKTYLSPNPFFLFLKKQTNEQYVKTCKRKKQKKRQHNHQKRQVWQIPVNIHLVSIQNLLQRTFVRTFLVKFMFLCFPYSCSSDWLLSLIAVWFCVCTYMLILLNIHIPLRLCLFLLIWMPCSNWWYFT